MEMSEMPCWYWERGLHDSKIISRISEELKYGYKERNPRRNCIRITIDSSKALYDNTIKEIIFYNAKIVEDASQLYDLWWYADKLEKVDGKWFLDITLKNHVSLQHLIIKFTDIEVKR